MPIKASTRHAAAIVIWCDAEVAIDADVVHERKFALRTVFQAIERLQTDATHR